VVIEIPKAYVNTRIIEKIRDDLRQVAKTWNKSDNDVRVTIK
jgi:hypothetical protein